MKMFQLMIPLILLGLAAGCATDSTSPKKTADVPALHECVFTYDVEGEARTFASYGETCPPDDKGWQDNGPTSGTVAPASATGSTAMRTMATTTVTLHKCVYTYYISGEKHTYTACAPRCPDHPDWRDLGIPCP